MCPALVLLQSMLGKLESIFLFVFAYIYIYTMRLLCYESRADATTQEQLWLCVRRGDYGWLSIGYDSYRWHIPEDRVEWAILIDPLMTRLPKLDYIV